VTLLGKAYTDFQLKSFDENLKSTFQGMGVEARVLGVTSGKWIQVSVSGEDQNVALRYLADRIGLCPAGLDNVQKFSTVKGRVAASNRDELRVDVGVFSPSVVDAAISLPRLRAQLADGRSLSLEEIVELFGLCPRVPLTVRIMDVSPERGCLEAELSEGQRRQYIQWVGSLLDRLLVLGASAERVEGAVERAGLNRDVVAVEHLGLFEHAVVCKLGTDAAGLIPRVGKNLRSAAFTVVSPRRILEFFDYRFPLSDFSVMK
jgi:hypothetical protein